MASRRMTAVAENLIGAVVLMIGGLVYLFRAIDYGIGSASEPGAGYFPALLGALLTLLSSGVLVRTLVAGRRARRQDNGPWPVRPMVCILGATLAFGVLLGGIPALGLDGLGLVPASAIAVFIAGFASRSLSVRDTLLLAGALAAAAWAIFILGLGLIIPAWPWSY